MTELNPHAFRFRPGMRRGYRSEFRAHAARVQRRVPALPQTAASGPSRRESSRTPVGSAEARAEPGGLY